MLHEKTHGELKGSEIDWIDWHLILWSITNQHFCSLPIASLTEPFSLNPFCHFFFSFTIFLSFVCISTHLPWLFIYHCRLWTAFCSILATSPLSSTPHHVLQRISFADAAAAVTGLDLPLPLPPSPAPPFLSSPHTATSPCSNAASAPERRLFEVCGTAPTPSFLLVSHDGLVHCRKSKHNRILP